MDKNMDQITTNFVLELMGLTENSPFPNEHLLEPLVYTKGFPEAALLFLLKKARKQWQYAKILASENLSLELLEKIIKNPFEFLPDRTLIIDRWNEAAEFTSENKYILNIYKAIAHNDTLNSSLIELLYNNAVAAGSRCSSELEDIASVIASHQALPPHLIIKLSNEYATTWIAENLIQRTDLPEEAILFLIRGKRGHIQDSIINAKSLSESVQLALADSNRYLIRHKLIERKDVTPNVLKYLLNRSYDPGSYSNQEYYQSERAKIGRKLLRNPQLTVPKEWATEFMFDDNEKVRKYARGCTRRKTTIAKTNNSGTSTLFNLDNSTENIQESTN